MYRSFRSGINKKVYIRSVFHINSSGISAISASYVRIMHVFFTYTVSFPVDAVRYEVVA